MPITKEIQLMKHVKQILIVMLLLTSQIIWGGVTGKISGKVVDKKTGEPLTGATILVLKTNLGASAQMDGSYFIINIPPGTYSLQAQYMGYTVIEKYVELILKELPIVSHWILQNSLGKLSC